jgi:hypothetical protein
MVEKSTHQGPVILSLRETLPHPAIKAASEITAENLLSQTCRLTYSGRGPVLTKATCGKEEGYICHIAPLNCSFFKDPHRQLDGTIVFQKPDQPLIFCRTVFIPNDTAAKVRAIRDPILLELRNEKIPQAA